ncbi:TM0106 family RecB-like putative nuclease [Hansschlegelia beijingensis]|uniref:Uncharacterized protein n=1 Tax=Hansschlegelia beijingensis TaxID=1133344 RepID=A0A7W6CVH4_9HYPH|nr:TM0106 family RecB-like putative nuclease [Hansschlegelia beijingensis]MBB3971858.1 uncharacterized protein [Hansschlegelia beijingensis]
MQLEDGRLLLSASDLVGHLNCRHLTELDRASAHRQLQRPQVWDPLLDLLRERGARHEQGYVDSLRAQGLGVVAIDGVGVDAAAVARTVEAMRAGAAVIVQGALRHSAWGGRADILLRVERPSQLGGWSYEPLDAKLARETKAGSVLQLCLYADLLAAVQGAWPETAYIVAPWTDYTPEPFRLADYAAYYRRVKAGLEDAVAGGPGATYPDPTTYCDVCRWRLACEARRREDDHLSLVAGISKIQHNELRAHGVETASALAALPTPLPWRPERGARESYERIREQARIQLEGRTAGALLYELLPVSAECGLPRLSEPSAGDIFLDLEGDPFVGEAGLEYLFGYAWAEADGAEQYRAAWALSRDAERQAFEGFIDFVLERLETYPDLHVYHFAPYEPAALKRLMGRYATREEALDRLLRAQVFVDLYAVTRRAIRASVESYSIKKLEPLYGFTREVPLVVANQALARLQAHLELGETAAIGPAERAEVEGYNRDDCISTWRLRDWLEARRSELVAAGVEVPRPEPVVGEAGEGVAAWTARIAPVMAALLQGVPDDPQARSAEQQGRWLLAHMLDWHRREQKAVWWEFFRLADLTAEDLLEERAAISGLEFVEAAGGTAAAPIHRYRFPPQETELRGGEELRSRGGGKFGKVEAISVEARWVDIKKRKDTATVHADAVFSHKLVPVEVLQESLLRLGTYVAENGLTGAGPYSAARDLLLRAPPPSGGGVVQQPGETTLDAALRLADALGPGVLPIQGPPGAGKTFTAARMICRLVDRGQTVAITANSHKVVRNLIDEVLVAAAEMSVDVICLQKPDVMEPNQARLRFAKVNGEVFAGLGSDCSVAGGTAWLWASPEAFESVDVLFVDEAAQMSLANVLAVAQCARTVVLLGDPQQLDQPLQGSHPDGTDASALHHLLEGCQTIPPERGLFLDETWRLHPRICAFTSEVFYEGRLQSRPGLEGMRLEGAGSLGGAGLRYLPVLHEGNQNASPEEAERVAALVRELLAAAPIWVDRRGQSHPLRLEDVLVIAPYNAQVFELQQRLPGARVGTVDKFQGQEAPLVIYSMTTSCHADAPRGMEFLYSLNRLNVATSRAKCVCVLAASPALLAADCRTPRQIQLVNAFCRYLELAEPV